MYTMNTSLKKKTKQKKPLSWLNNTQYYSHKYFLAFIRKNHT